MCFSPVVCSARVCALTFLALAIAAVWTIDFRADASEPPPRESEPVRDGGIIKNQSSPHAQLESVDLGSVQWTRGFWADQFKKTQDVTLPRLWELADPWAWHNMRVAAKLQTGEAKGCYWEDAWIYKC